MDSRDSIGFHWFTPRVLIILSRVVGVMSIPVLECVVFSKTTLHIYSFLRVQPPVINPDSTFPTDSVPRILFHIDNACRSIMMIV